MAAGYALHQGHRSTDYAMTWLGRWAELRPAAQCAFQM